MDRRHSDKKVQEEQKLILSVETATLSGSVALTRGEDVLAALARDAKTSHSNTLLNDIDRLFRTIKHHDLPERTCATFDDLLEPVQAAFTRYEHTHCLEPAFHPGLAA